MGQAPDYTSNLLGYGNDVFGTGYNAATGARIASGNDAAAKQASWLGLIGNIFKCWIAREVYGAENPQWKIFRSWLENKAPTWFHDLYLEHGETLAEFIKDKPTFKAAIRTWMDARIEEYVNGEETSEDAFNLSTMKEAA